MATAGGNTETDWDPMKSESESFMNTMFQIKDSDILGSGSSLRNTVSIPCPHYDPVTSVDGKCFKGMHCTYYHGKHSSATLKKLPKLAVPVDNEEIIITTDLPQKEIAADGFITVAWITSAIDPGEFYLLPKYGWNCMCTPVNVSEDETGISSNWADFQNFEEIHNNLQQYRFQPRFQPTSYVTGQLVAVQLVVNGNKKQWFRAVVLEDTMLDDVVDTAPPVKVRLLDYGICAIKTIKEVTPLCKDFCHISAMAFKCRLNGISPITGFWSSPATKYFQELVQGQFVLLEVKQTIKDVDGLFNLFENEPYLIDVYVKRNGNYVNVAEKLVKEGLVLQWNMYKWRPFVGEILPYWKNSFMQPKVTTESLENDNKISKIVRDREQSRLKKYINRYKHFQK